MKHIVFLIFILLMNNTYAENKLYFWDVCLDKDIVSLTIKSNKFNKNHLTKSMLAKTRLQICVSDDDNVIETLQSNFKKQCENVQYESLQDSKSKYNYQLNLNCNNEQSNIYLKKVKPNMYEGLIFSVFDTKEIKTKSTGTLLIKKTTKECTDKN